MPNTSPAAVSLNASPATSRNTLEAVAPSAIRTPISAVRRVTMYASTPYSPITATTGQRRPCSSFAAAMPSAAEIAVEAWPAPKASCSLSVRQRKGASPPALRIVENCSRRPVTTASCPLRAKGHR